MQPPLMSASAKARANEWRREKTLLSMATLHRVLCGAGVPRITRRCEIESNVKKYSAAR